MERVITTIVLVMFSVYYGCSQVPVKAEKQQEMYFADTVYNFGEIPLNDPAICNFQFVNQGKLPLVISSVSSSCSCAVSAWTKRPVKKGRHGLIRVTYNSGLPGRFRKTITVYSNANNSPVQLMITGYVIKQEKNHK